MLVLLIFAFISGLLTILAPCIWPLLPIILSSSVTGGKLKPFGVVIGIMISFTVFTLSISYIIKLISFDPNVLRFFAVVVIAFFGLTLLIPRLNSIFEERLNRLSGKFSPHQQGTGFISGFITGFALGLVWSPCAGPILATISVLAATQKVNLEIILVTVIYVLGVGIPLFIFSIVGWNFFRKHKGISRNTGNIQRLFGIVMVITAITIYANLDTVIQAKFLNTVPSYSDLLYKLEGNPLVKKELDRLQQKKTNPMSKLFTSSLPELGSAPEFIGISKWLNSEPLTMSMLKGKVVLVDFWTYTCINCIRTLPYVTGWYEKYKDKGFVVIGVHTPEFEFEKKTENVENAITQYNIHYPVAQDNDYATWNAFNNQYWPAHYLIDAKGNIRYTHFGEGSYDETEMNIQSLLTEEGKTTDEKTLTLQDQTPQYSLTPETYMGTARRERYVGDFSSVPTHFFSLQGNWDTQSEYIQSKKGVKLKLHFYAQKVFLVITPQGESDSIKVILDNKIISKNQAGIDVNEGVVKIDTARLYNLVDFKASPSDHYLELDFGTDGTKIFAFTFG